ncbi:MAG: hypothetical protein PUC65_01925 [Clostridiales bacterium]|nr:hypothetical protein [Clostridiales bacterium]
MSEDGEIEGLLIGLAVCGVITIIFVLAGMKERRKISHIVEQLPKEDIEKLRLSQFLESHENANFLVGSSIIYDIVNRSNDVEINLVFYDYYYDMFKIDSVHITKEVYNKRDFKVGQMVETVHNRKSEVWLRVKEIL